MNNKLAGILVPRKGFKQSRVAPGWQVLEKVGDGRQETGDGGVPSNVKKCNNKSETQPGLAVRQLSFGSLSFAILHNSLACLTVRMLYFSNQPPAPPPPPSGRLVTLCALSVC